MKKKFTNVISLSLLFMLSTSLVGCNTTPTYDIHTEEQAKYLEGDYNLISLYADGTKELSKPDPVYFEFDPIKGNELTNFYCSQYEDFSVLESHYQMGSNSYFVALENLQINTTYYLYIQNGDIKSEVKTFNIESHAPRVLDIDGLTNARDLGGYITDDGTYTNQGLIYRTSRLNENESTLPLITKAGVAEMTKHLKIKSELDLRRVDNNENGGITESPLGEGVNYYSVPMKSGGNCIILNEDVIKNAFEVLGNKDNYPVVIHCSIGTDRTGMLCFLINALLGVSEEDLYKDYLFSNFANIGGNRTPSTIKGYIDTFKYSDGKTLAEKTKSYLIEIGVSEEDINTVIEMMK
jgi:hypothetical protein